MSNLPSLTLLRSFDAAARHESFTAAAEELRINQAAVSRQVRDFEAIIGTPLFRKEGRGVALTPAGRILARRISGQLSDLRRTLETAQAAGRSGKTLSIAALPTFSSHWLAPRLDGFREKHPDVTLLVHSRSVPFDLSREGIDLAFHFGAPEWVGGTVSLLCPETLVVVASPVLIEWHNVCDEDALHRLPRLHLMTRRHLWPRLFEELGQTVPDPGQGAQFDQFSAMIAASISGYGAAIVPGYLIERELAQGVLVPLASPKATDGAYYVVTPRGVANPTAAAFTSWVRAQATISTRSRQLG